MNDLGELQKLQDDGDTLEVARLAGNLAAGGGDSFLTLNAILFAPGTGDPQGRIQKEKARHLELLKHASDPRRAALLYNLGCFALYSDDILTAKLRFGEAARLRPGHYPTLHNLAHAHELMADFEDAQRELERALNVNPGCVLTRINLAGIYMEMGEVDQGLEILRELAAEHPENMSAALYLCRGLLEYAGQESAQEVRTLLEQRSEWKAHAELKIYRAYACYQTEAWEEAETLFGELLEADQGSAFARMGLIKVLARQGRFDESLQHLDRYRDMHPSQSIDDVIQLIKGS